MYLCTNIKLQPRRKRHSGLLRSRIYKTFLTAVSCCNLHTFEIPHARTLAHTLKHNTHARARTYTKKHARMTTRKHTRAHTYTHTMRLKHMRTHLHFCVICATYREPGNFFQQDIRKNSPYVYIKRAPILSTYLISYKNDRICLADQRAKKKEDTKLSVWGLFLKIGNHSPDSTVVTFSLERILSGYVL